jgi:hypothetical protein
MLLANYFDAKKLSNCVIVKKVNFGKTRAKRAQELPKGSGLIFGFQVSDMDCLPEVFPGFLGLFKVWFGRFGLVYWDFPGLIDGTYQI